MKSTRSLTDMELITELDKNLTDIQRIYLKEIVLRWSMLEDKYNMLVGNLLMKG